MTQLCVKTEALKTHLRRHTGDPKDAPGDLADELLTGSVPQSRLKST